MTDKERIAMLEGKVRMLNRENRELKEELATEKDAKPCSTCILRRDCLRRVYPKAVGDVQE